MATSRHGGPMGLVTVADGAGASILWHLKQPLCVASSLPSEYHAILLYEVSATALLNSKGKRRAASSGSRMSAPVRPLASG